VSCLLDHPVVVDEATRTCLERTADGFREALALTPATSAPPLASLAVSA
jgi:hypothetical protein